MYIRLLAVFVSGIRSGIIMVLWTGQKSTTDVVVLFLKHICSMRSRCQDEREADVKIMRCQCQGKCEADVEANAKSMSR